MRWQPGNRHCRSRRDTPPALGGGRKALGPALVHGVAHGVVEGDHGTWWRHRQAPGHGRAHRSSPARSSSPGSGRTRLRRQPASKGTWATTRGTRAGAAARPGQERTTCMKASTEALVRRGVSPSGRPSCWARASRHGRTCGVGPAGNWADDGAAQVVEAHRAADRRSASDVDPATPGWPPRAGDVGQLTDRVRPGLVLSPSASVSGVATVEPRSAPCRSETSPAHRRADQLRESHQANSATWRSTPAPWRSEIPKCWTAQASSEVPPSPARSSWRPASPQAWPRLRPSDTAPGRPGTSAIELVRREPASTAQRPLETLVGVTGVRIVGEWSPVGGRRVSGRAVESGIERENGRGRRKASASEKRERQGRLCEGVRP